jgi:D-glycero-D-manno-heptose 1,7-bisphosphate phosphatase
MRKNMHRSRCCYDSGVSDAHKSFASREIHTMFLDRDGVLNEKMPEGQYVRSWSEFHLLPAVPESIARLNRAGRRVIVVSNQRGIALGLYTAADVEAIHEQLQAELATHGAHVDAFLFCPHDKNQCDCRKPLPGMFLEARLRFPDVSANTSLMIGDSLSDIEFGHRLGMATIFIEGDEERRKSGGEMARELADLHTHSLVEAVEAVLNAIGI